MEDDNEYKLFGMLETVTSSDVDMSNLHCGINSAFYIFVIQGPYLVIVGSGPYLMEDVNEYKLFRRLEKGISFDVDMSNRPCRFNSASTSL